MKISGHRVSSRRFLTEKKQIFSSKRFVVEPLSRRLFSEIFTFIGINVELAGIRQKHASFIRVQVDDQTYESHSFAKGTSISWDCEMYVRLMQSRILGTINNNQI